MRGVAFVLAAALGWAQPTIRVSISEGVNGPPVSGAEVELIAFRMIEG